MKRLITTLVHTDPLSAVKGYLALTSSQSLTFKYLNLRLFSQPAWTPTLCVHSVPRSSLNGEFSVPGAVHAPTSYCTLTWFLPDKISLILHISTLHGFQTPSRNQSPLLKFTRKTVLLYG